MRYNERIVYQNEMYPANVSNMGATDQQLVFGDVKQGRIIVRMRPEVAFRTGYFEYHEKTYLIKSNLTVNGRTILTGTESRANG